MLTHFEIEERVSDLRSCHGYDENVTDIDKLASDLGAQVVYKDLEDSVSGFLFIKGTRKIIVVNKNHPENRKRFTLAHELGHLCLHAEGSTEDLFMDKKQVYNRNIASGSGMNPQEIEANRFAAALLMPKHLILTALEEERHFLEDCGGENDSLGTLARKFQVSEQALSNRLSSLLRAKSLAS